MNTTITGSQMIAGAASREGTQTFGSVNPHTKQAGEVQFVNATPAEIDRAVRAAQAAYAESRRYPAAKLAAFLDLVAAEIEALGDALLEVTDAETGLGTARLSGERGRTTGQLRKFAALLREGSYVEAIIDTAQPERQPAPRPDIRRMLFPIGPVAVFAASNFPYAFSVAGGDTASAFAAGCPVILKAHPGHPATSELVGQALTRAVAAAGFPAGFFALLQGDQIEVGQNLVTHPGVMAVGFTGSLRAGRAIYNAAAARPTPIPVYAEMGSINPLVLLPGALAQRGADIAAGLAASVTLGSGQFCTNPGLVFLVDGAAGQQFLSAFVARMQEKQPGVLLNAQIERGLAQAVAGTAAHPAVRVLTGAEPLPVDFFCYPHTVLHTTARAFREDEALQVEHFGPVTLVVGCESPDDLLHTLEHLDGNLTGSIHATDDDLPLAREVFERLRERVGRLLWNGYPTGVEVVHAMQHGGPYPATTAPATTSVGMTAIKRFMRPVAFQNMPATLLPPALQDDNPLGIWRIVDDQWTQAASAQ